MTITRLRKDVESLALTEGRAVGSDGHAKAKDYLIGRLTELGLTPYGHSFKLPYENAGLSNIIGVAPGTDSEAAPMLIAAHHDTVHGTPGADDNAAAVAIALEVAARLKETPAERSVIIALFDAEEPPYFHSEEMGSTWFYNNQLRDPIHAAIVLDLVGHATPVPGIEDLMVITGMESDPGLEGVVASLGDPEGLQLVTVLNHYAGDMSDHHVFRLNQVPYLFLTCGRWPHYHRTTDTPEKLDYDKMARITSAVETLTREGSATKLDGPWESYDTTATDLANMRRTLGPIAAQMGVALNTRNDIGELVQRMLFGLGL